MRDKRTPAGHFTYYSGIDDLLPMSPEQKIRWFRRRFSKVIVRPLQAVARIGINKEAIWDLNLGVVTIICQAIEALGSFNAPGVKDHIAFDNFVSTFMHADFRKKTVNGETYAEILYGKFRCGLAHGFSIEGHEITTRPSQFIEEDANGHLSIDLWTLFRELRNAFEAFMQQVETNKSAKKRFIDRFDAVFVDPYR
jgi:hypothetical protein